MNKWIPLENCMSGEILISAKFVPLQLIGRPAGNISLTVHRAKKMKKRNCIMKANAYVVIKLGQEKHKSETVNNSRNPTWNYDVTLDIMMDSPRQISFQVFDDDAGHEVTLGNMTLDTDAIIKKEKLENLWTRLENCKSGELIISAKFTPMPVDETKEAEISTISIKKEVIAENFEESKVQTKSMEEQNLALKKQSHFVTEKHHQTIKFVDPIYCDDEFVIVEKDDNNWFMVGSFYHYSRVLFCT